VTDDLTDDLITRIVAAHRFMIAAPLPGISVERPDAAGAPSPAASKSAPLGSLPVPPAGATPTGYPPPDDVADALDWIAYTARFADLPGDLIDRIVAAYHASPAYATRCDDEANNDWNPATAPPRHAVTKADQ
jgi:hypothetical protein